MGHFLNRGNRWHPHAAADLEPHSVLPAGNYVVKVDEFKRYYLDAVAEFTLPPRLYGDTTRHTRRIIDTFKARDGATGVLLAGNKGSGKTLLSKNISLELAQEGVPTIIVNSPWCGEDFNTFIQIIEQPCVILFDEFEKVYGKEHQPHLLTLLDGVFPSKKLFVLTCNDVYRVDSHMRNRPGRIYYFMEFKGLDAAFIEEYCQENLQHKEHIEKICTITQLFSDFNFDMLKALVEEMNRYGEDPQTALGLLNITPETDNHTAEFDVRVLHDGRQYSGPILRNPTHTGNPFDLVEVWINTNPEAKCFDDVGANQDIGFHRQDFVRYDARHKTFHFKNSQGSELFLTKIVRRPHSIYAV